MQCSITPPLTPMPPALKKKAPPLPTCPGKDFKKKKEGMEFSQFQHSLQPVLFRRKTKRKTLHSHPVSFRTFQLRSDSVHRLVFSIAKITPSSVTSGINFKQQSHSIFLGMCNMPRVIYCVTPFIMVVLFLYSTGSHRQNTIGMLLSRLMNWKVEKGTSEMALNPTRSCQESNTIKPVPA